MDDAGRATYARLFACAAAAAGLAALAVAVSRPLTIDGTGIALWFPLGVTAVSALRWGRAGMAGAVLGTAAATTAFGVTHAESLALAVAGAVSATIAVVLWERLIRPRVLRPVPTVLAFDGLLAVACVPHAVTVGYLVLADGAPVEVAATRVAVAWLGALAAAAFVAPLMLWVGTPPSRRPWERAALLSAGVLLSFLAFTDVPTGTLNALGGYTLLPIVLLVAFRHRPPDMVVLFAITGPIAFWGATRGAGPFVTPDPVVTDLALQFSLHGMTMACLALSSAVTERADALDALRSLTRDLEFRIEERTHDLREANRALEQEIVLRTQVERDLSDYRDHLDSLVAQRTAELVATNDQLALALRSKDRMLASMSHELRTPLNSIQGFIGVILQGLAGEINDEQRKQLGMARRSASQLLSLVEDALELARIDSGTIVAVMEPFDVQALADELRESVAIAAAEKGLELRVTAPDGPAMVSSDQSKLRQILLNLLTNAVKFTPAGVVALEVDVEPDRVLFSVTDTGPGIPVEERTRVFDEFHQLPQADRAKPEGAGLGLSIAARLARALGGDIRVEGAAGLGSCFIVSIPRGTTLPAAEADV